MTKSTLITRPDSDITTKYLSVWTEKVIDVANKKRVNYFDLYGDRANKKLFDSYQHRHEPKFIFINGHGNSEHVEGQSDEYLISADDKDLAKYKDAIIYSRSCKSAMKLGQVMVNSGLSTFVGYANDFVFFRSTGFGKKPFLDPIAKLFLAPSNLIAISIIKGNTVKVANNKSRYLMKKNLRKMLSSSATRDESELASYLWSNLNAQIVIGDETQCLD